MADVVCPDFIGREAESAAARARLAAAGRGRGTAVFVVGGPGIGKTRLAREVAATAAGEGVRVLSGRAVPGPVDAPLRPIAEVVMRALRDRGIPDDPDLRPWLPALWALAPELAPEAAGAGRDLPWQDAAITRAEAMIRLLRWVGGAGPLLVLLEDLHWADAETLATIDYLADNLGSERVLLLGTVRDTPSAALDLARRAQRRGAAALIRLGPLPAAAVDAMVRACAPGADDALVARVRSTADGVPLLVEELVATPGIPASIDETVRTRFGVLSADEQLVVATAAVLGRDFDWRVLEPITHRPADVVAAALERATAALLVEVVDDEFRFRHALVRDAVVASMMPPRRTALARAALTVLDRLRPDGDHAELAAQAGDPARAAAMLTASGTDALARGAPGTAVDRLRRAVDIAPAGDPARAARIALIQALALTGHLDEARGIAGPLLRTPGDRAGAIGLHLDLATAAVSATRWTDAASHLDAAAALADPADPAEDPVTARIGVLTAEIALAAGDVEAARRSAEAALATGDAGLRCHALEILGRSHRVHDLDAARAAFVRAYDVADRADLPVRRLRALHELGTIDLLDHGGVDRLGDARRIAAELGLLSTVAVLDLQLAGAHLQQFDLAAAGAATAAAVSTARALSLGRLQAAAHVFEACIAALLGDRDDVARATADALRLTPGDPEITGLTSTGAAGVVELLWGGRAAALTAMDRGMALLHTVPHSPPGPYRGLWPLAVAVAGRADAAEALDAVRRSGVAVNRVNRGYLSYAEAVIARSVDAVGDGDADLAYFPVWWHIGRALVAEAALRDDWGEPARWLTDARDCFVRHGLHRMARRADEILGRPESWRPPGASARELDVLDLLAAGLPNREIAERLRVSVRTVEKHVESLLRKAPARSRTELTAMVRRSPMGGTT